MRVVSTQEGLELGDGDDDDEASARSDASCARRACNELENSVLYLGSVALRADESVS